LRNRRNRISRRTGAADFGPGARSIRCRLKQGYALAGVVVPPRPLVVRLPYIVDDGETIGDSETIIAHLIEKCRLTIDGTLTTRERDQNLLIARMLDDLYWVMSYSRWKDERYWPAFRDALMREHPSLTGEGLLKAREFNFQRYHFQGIGRFAPDAAYARGLADLKVLANAIPASGYVHGPQPTSIDAGIYGFIANIYFYAIDTPLKQFVASQENVVRHCIAIHEPIARK
jgi:hypothetical protein